MLKNYAASTLLALGLLILGQDSRGLAEGPPGDNPGAPGHLPAADGLGADPFDIDRIREEALHRSQVMTTLSYLTDVIGPRLSGSPQLRRAGQWTRDKMTEWGLRDARLEEWGRFGRGWSLRRFGAQVIAPQCIPLIAYPFAWSPGTRGEVTGPVVPLEAEDEAGLRKYEGKLRGAIVLVGRTRELGAWFVPQAIRLTDRDLLDMDNDRSESSRTPSRSLSLPPYKWASPLFRGKLGEFLTAQGAAVALYASDLGDGGTLKPGAFDSHQDPALNVPSATVAIEHFNRMVRMIRQGEELRAAVEIAVDFHDDDPAGYNTVAEIPGSDLKDEIVMLGAHLDSCHGGTGATDDGAGVAVCMEAVRILRALDLRPRRTIRIALWTGHEQGVFGSKAYVAKHFGTEVDKTPEYDRLSAYINIDNGTGKIRGVRLGAYASARPIVRRWLLPFRDLGAEITTAAYAGSDGSSFGNVGLPGLSLVQDPIEYDSRTHHTNMDVYERCQADDLKQASAVMAALVYNAAMAGEGLQRLARQAK